MATKKNEDPVEVPLPFKLGDIVKLKSGGPRMTVSRVSRYPTITFVCKWFGGSKAMSEDYPAEALVLVDDEDEGEDAGE